MADPNASLYQTLSLAALSVTAAHSLGLRSGGVIFFGVRKLTAFASLADVTET